MIAYTSPKNIDDRILARCSNLLADGGLIAFPTDTSWSIGCSWRSREGIRKLRSLSASRDEGHFTLLSSDIARLSELCSLDTPRFRLLKRLTPGPYVFLLTPFTGSGKALELKRKEIGVRIPDHPLPCLLVETLGECLYTITAKKSMAGEAVDEEGVYEDGLFESGWELEGIDGIDLILDTGEERPRLLSTIVDLTGDRPVVVRKGAGDWDGEGF